MHGSVYMYTTGVLGPDCQQVHSGYHDNHCNNLVIVDGLTYEPSESRWVIMIVKVLCSHVFPGHYDFMGL